MRNLPGMRIFAVRTFAEQHFRTILSVLLLGALLLIPVRPAHAIDPERTLSQVLIRKWLYAQGLPQPRVLAIRQTIDGRLWLGTQSGLFQFDGVRFTAVESKHGASLANIWVQQLLEDAEHQLWIATMGDGLLCLNDGACVRYGLQSGLPSLNVQCLLLDHRGTLWVGTDQGAARLIEGKFETFAPQKELTVRNVRALCESRQGTVFLGGDRAQLNLWRDGQFLTRELSTVPDDSVVRALLSTPEGDLLVGTTTGLVRLDANGESRIGRAEGLADDFVETLAWSSTGQVWVGTRDGLSRLRDHEIETLRTRDGLSQSTVCAIFEDHEKSMWIGTKNGLNQFVDRRTVPITMSEGLPSNETGALLQDPSGKIWIGTLDAGLATFLGRRCEAFANRETGLPSDRIAALAAGADSQLWVGTDSGLCRMKGAEVVEKFTTREGLPADAIQVLLPDSSGALWIGTSRGLARWDGQKIAAVAPESELSKWPVRVLLESADQDLIVATDGGGLYRCRDDQVLPWMAGVPEVRSLTALQHGPAGSYWAATRGDGLLLLQDEKVIRISVQQGLFDDEIFGLLDDGEGRLWMACSRGIFFVNQEELLELVAGGRQSVTCTQFSPVESQRTIECQQGVQPSVWKMKDGRIWFSTIYGVIIMDPAALYRKLPPPTVSLEEMQVNGQAVTSKEKLKLPAGPTNLMFRYTAWSFASASRIRFRYKLEGFDHDWVEANQRREAYYTNVPPGRYRFLVSAANPNNEWSTITVPAEFTVRPYFFKTLWFYGLTLLMLGLAVWGILRLRVLQVKTRLNAALAERMRIARDLHDTLIQGFSGVTMQMQAFATRLKNPEERATLQDVIDDAGRCLREARQTVTGLRHAPGSSTSLVDAISQTARHLTETHDLHLELKMPSAIPPLSADVEYNLLRIAQEAIVNVVKHAGASTVEVTLSRSVQNRGPGADSGRATPSGPLVLSVVDDGCGFDCDDFRQLPGHYGLIGMRERALQIHATLNIHSRTGRGTSVEVILPHLPSHETAGAAPLTREVPLAKDPIS
ncbi:sensor histidine kinase [Planctomicrobium sp. SH661]|uniref:sensor histidine kinase n=1 Tax=Planctomicrobium sp. SH661 TaxID=3448124 RepID=UPI003F5B379B